MNAIVTHNTSFLASHIQRSTTTSKINHLEKHYDFMRLITMMVKSFHAHFYGEIRDAMVP